MSIDRTCVEIKQFSGKCTACYQDEMTQIQLSSDCNGVLQVDFCGGFGCTLEEIEELFEIVSSIKIDAAAGTTLETDLRILSDSPEDFFSAVDLEKDYPGFDCTEKTALPAALKEQIEALYKTKFVCCNGYWLGLIRSIQENNAEKISYFPGNRCGVLVVDQEHVFGIMQFDNLKKYVAEDWNRRHKSPKFYSVKENRMNLVKQFSLDDQEKIPDANWYDFFTRSAKLL